MDHEFNNLHDIGWDYMLVVGEQQIICGDHKNVKLVIKNIKYFVKGTGDSFKF